MGKARVRTRENPARLYGCPLSAWSGSFILKASNSVQDVNAPPDVLSVLERELLVDYLKRQGIRRVFCCGLAMDFCVMDTALNAALEPSFEQVHVIFDAARAAHIPDIPGTHGSGFLSDPAEMKAKMSSRSVKLVTARYVIGDSFTPENPFETTSTSQAAVPEQLGPVSDDADEEAPEAPTVADLQLLRDEGWSVVSPEEFYISELHMAQEQAARNELELAKAKAQIEK